MRGWVLLLAMAALLTAGGSAALPPPNADPHQPVSFWEKGSGTLPPNFQSRRDGNRVFYARSLKQARKGAFRFTALGLPYNPVDVDFKKYGVLGVFYKGHSAGFEAEAQSVEESAAGTSRPRSRSGATTRRTARLRRTTPRTHGASTSFW
jgi:hypothetical protein